MKTLRHTCAAIILTLALAVSVLAGEIDCPGVVGPTPTPTPTQMQTESTTATVTDSITTTIILVIIDLIP
jgi:hypothetical protein